LDKKNNKINPQKKKNKIKIKTADKKRQKDNFKKNLLPKNMKQKMAKTG